MNYFRMRLSVQIAWQQIKYFQENRPLVFEKCLYITIFEDKQVFSQGLSFLPPWNKSTVACIHFKEILENFWNLYEED